MTTATDQTWEVVPSPSSLRISNTGTEGEKQQPSLTKPTDPFFGIPNAGGEDDEPW